MRTHIAVIVVAALAMAALVYPLLRSKPRPPSGEYLPGWLTLGPTTLLVAMVTLGVQAAIFVWQ